MVESSELFWEAAWQRRYPGAGEWLHQEHGTKTRRNLHTLHIGTNADIS